MASLLLEECEQSAPSDSADAARVERIWFAVLKLGGDLDTLLLTLGRAQIDWRDVLIAARTSTSLAPIGAGQVLKCVTAT